jgi:hypothetical protein
VGEISATWQREHPQGERLLLHYRRILALLVMLVALPVSAREEIILTQEQFLAEMIGAPPPKPEVLWLTRELAAQANKILGHAPLQLRQRYWAAGGRTAWILEEIGKEEPITAGFVVESGRIKQARVLVYRESRGGEIRYPAFLKQYEDVALTDEGRLDRGIDGISGATLSVRAMERMARLALYFDSMTRAKGP